MKLAPCQRIKFRDGFSPVTSQRSELRRHSVACFTPLLTLNPPCRTGSMNPFLASLVGPQKPPDAYLASLAKSAKR